MRKFRVFLHWDERRHESYEVEAENEDEAEEKVYEANDEIGDDYSIDRVVDCGEIIEPPYIDPNQLELLAEG